MIRWIPLLALFVLGSAAAQFGPPSMTPADARALQESGEIVLVDIRQPEEWRQTGIPEGAVTVSMGHPEGGQGFLRDLLAAVDGDTDAKVVLICRTGNRTSQVVPALQQWGFTQVYHVSQGMLGNQSGPGWMRAGLPVEDCTTC